MRLNLANLRQAATRAGSAKNVGKRAVARVMLRFVRRCIAARDQTCCSLSTFDFCFCLFLFVCFCLFFYLYIYASPLSTLAIKIWDPTQRDIALGAASPCRHQTAGTGRSFMGGKLWYTGCCSAFGRDNASECH